MEFHDCQAVLTDARVSVLAIKQLVCSLMGRMPAPYDFRRRELDEAVDGILRVLDDAEGQMRLLYQELQKEIDCAES